MKNKITLEDFLSHAYEHYPLSNYPESLEGIPTDIIEEMKKHFEIVESEI